MPGWKGTEHGGEVKIELSAFGAEYSGTLSATKNEIAGQWSQNGNDEKLDFRRSEQILELRRPQNPAKPYPYKEEEVSIAIGDGKTTLAGTLTLPPGAGPFPSAIFFGGWGTGRSYGNVTGHRPV